MEKEHRRLAKGQMIELMQAGHSWQAATARAGISLCRAAAYRLLSEVRTRGEAALQDGRHGHAAKLCPPVRAFVETMCREAPHTPSREVQAALQERFGIHMSIGHLNRVRAELGVGSRAVGREKNGNSLALQRNLAGKKGQGDCSSGFASLDSPTA
jgi:transposase